MKWEMWWRVLLVLFVLGVGEGHVEGNGMNKDVFDKLCNITKGVKVLINQRGEGTGPLHEALYGANGGAQFDKNGRFTSGCGLTMHSRSQYCSHLPGPSPTGSDKHGCFGHSLVGTFLCTCVHGNDQEKDLCGLGTDVENGAKWTGGISGNDDNHPQKLFKKVWWAINKTCTENSTTAHLENLKAVVEEIKKTAQEKKLSNGHYLGSTSSTNGRCSGVNSGDACVTYPANGNSHEPNIPWADRILSAIQTIKDAKQQKKSQNSDETAHKVDHEDFSDPDPVDDDDHEEEEGEEESAQNHDPQNPSKTPRTRRKRDSTQQPTQQPAEPLTAHPSDDSSFLPQPSWLLSAVVI